jgi:hypothetical protein
MEVSLSRVRSAKWVGGWVCCAAASALSRWQRVLRRGAGGPAVCLESLHCALAALNVAVHLMGQALCVKEYWLRMTGFRAAAVA